MTPSIIGARSATRYNTGVIRRIRHKGLRLLYQSGSIGKVPAQQVSRLRRILALLDVATSPDDLAGLPGLRLHPLKGQYAGFWAVSVSGNWRVVFRFEEGEATDVDLVDSH